MTDRLTCHSPYNPARPTSPNDAALTIDLEIVRGKAQSKVRSVNVPAFLLGSAGDCDLVLGDPQFSEVHAYLLTSEEGVSLRHLGFAPEVAVNGEVVTRTTLVDGDRIRTGPYEFVIRIARKISRTPTRRPVIDDNREPTEAVEEDSAIAAVYALLAEVRQLRPHEGRLRLFRGEETSLADEAPEPLWRTIRGAG